MRKHENSCNTSKGEVKVLDKMVLWSSAKTDDEHREPAVNSEGRQYQGTRETHGPKRNSDT